MATAAIKEIGEISNGGKVSIEMELPYTALVEIEGSADLLLHAWNVDSIEAKSKARKGSAAKKSDDLESYVRRNEEGLICIPGEYVRMAIIGAAKYRQDPRSPRKSAQDLFKAGVVSMDPLVPIIARDGKSTKEWDFEDRRRVTVQRAGITRSRPAFHAGWRMVISILVLTPEYIGANDLHETLSTAGKLIGIGDFRPTFGRFQVRTFEVIAD